MKIQMGHHQQHRCNCNYKLSSLKISVLFLVIFQLLNSSSNEVQATLVQLDPSSLNQLYYSKLHPDQSLIITNNSKIYKNHTLNSILTLLTTTSFHNIKSIELTNFNNLFKSCKNQPQKGCQIVELFIPTELNQLNSTDTIKLELLNLTNNHLTEKFLEIAANHSSIYTPFFNIRLLVLSLNKLKHLERKHFLIFQQDDQTRLETLLLNSNKISSIRHDTFYGLAKLKYLDLSNNNLKLIHPLTFCVHNSQLTLLNLKNNRLRTLFYTPRYKEITKVITNVSQTDPITTIISDNSSLSNLEFLYLEGNKDLTCNCGLLWLYQLKESITLDNFTCSNTANHKHASNTVPFVSINNASLLEQSCTEPGLFVNTDSLAQTSSFTLFRSWATRWFDWTLLVDIIPATTPYPYLMSDEKKDEINENYKEFNKYIDYLNRNDSEKIGASLEDQEKHVFHTWRTSDVVFDCTNKDPNADVDETNSTIIWKTQHGYLSYLDKDLTDSLNSYLNEELGIEEDTNKEDSSKTASTSSPLNSEQFRNSFKIFYQLNKLTKIYNNLTVRVGQKFGGESYSNYQVNAHNQLIVTNMRQIVAGPFVCISINEKGIKTYEYDIHVRVGIDEYFIYCLFVSVLSGFIPSIISLVICCICEYKAARDYNIIRHYTCNPTPNQGATPPNFDFNDWMANAASYLPNINIQDTLDQVSKKLRKGMGKASVAVRTLGITGSAYIYSVYEHSTQKWSDMKGYVPSLNVPTITMPTMRYPPMGLIANRMRMGMGNMLFQVKEFCGSSDLNHTISIGDLEIETSASNAVGGQTFIFEKMDKKRVEKEQQHHNQFQGFLNFLREEARNMNRSKRRQTANSITEDGEAEYIENQSECDNIDGVRPSTSTGFMDDLDGTKTVVALPKLNMIITFSNVNGDIEKIEKLPEDDVDENEDNDFDDEEKVRMNELIRNNDFNKKLYAQAKDEATNLNDIPFIDVDSQ